MAANPIIRHTATPTPLARRTRPVMIFLVAQAARTHRQALCWAVFVLALAIALLIVARYPNTVAHHGAAALLAFLVAVPFALARMGQ